MIWTIAVGISLILFIVFTLVLSKDINRLKGKYEEYIDNNSLSREEFNTEKYLDYKTMAVKQSISLLFLLIPVGYGGIIVISKYDVILFQNVETALIGLGSMIIFCLLNFTIHITSYKLKRSSRRNSL